MSRVSKLEQITNLVFYVTLQLFLTQFFFLFHFVFCFVYVAFFLLLPQRQGGSTVILFIGFAVGLLIDIFYNSMGVHSFASVLMIYSRSILSKHMLPVGEYETATQLTLDKLGWKQFSWVALPLIGIHHAVWFLLSSDNPQCRSMPMRNWLLSTLLTYVAILITQIPKALLSRR